MTWIQFRILAARFRPRFAKRNPALETEGAGNAGRSMRPQPRMQNKKAYEYSHHGHIGFIRHSPRNGFNKLLRALPGDQGFVDTVTGGIGVSGPTGPTSPSAGLTPTLRRQDHTFSPSASAPFVKGASTSTASRSASVTIASRPLGGTGRHIYNPKIRTSQVEFCKSER
jgi:hypothetical protein